MKFDLAATPWVGYWSVGCLKTIVIAALKLGEPIADYPNDRPYPSRLILWFSGSRPIHVVAAQDPETQICFIITAYEPDPSIWLDNFKTRGTP